MSQLSKSRFLTVLWPLLVACGPTAAEVRQTALPQNTPVENLYSSSRAVVIGVSTYETKALPQLPTARDDALKVKAELERQGFTIVKELVEREQTTRAKLMGVLGDELLKDVDANGRLLIYYAGHGWVAPNGGHAYLMPSDGDPERPNESAVPMILLRHWLSSYRARNVLVVTDACYSGAAMERANELIPMASSSAAAWSREVLTAGAAGQRAHLLQGQGAFSYFFLEALRLGDANLDGYVSGGEIATYVGQRVYLAVKERYGAEQTPLYLHDGAGDFLFGSTGRWWPPPTGER